MAVKGKGKQIAGRSPASSASSSGKRKRTSADGESSCAVPKKKPSGVHQFVDDAAADADFEGVEEEDDLDWEIDEDFDFELPDIGAKEVKNLTRGPGKSSPLPFFIKEEEMNDDELEEAIKERYRGSGFVSFDEDVKESDQSLLVAHAAKDLSVWRVKCMMGRERQAAFCLMQKFVDLQKIGKKLQIFSVFALDHVKGFFYVEADRACNVFEACNGLCILYPSRIELVPRNEAPNLLSIQRKACGISKGMWVRMKNGKYKGDLAEVVLVNDAKKRVTIKLVPRIDLQAISKKFGGGTSLKAAAIPTPRLISSHELEDFRPHIEIRRDRETGEIFEVLDGLMLKDGYLYKKVSMGSLIHWGVQPTSDELTKFEDLGNDEVKDVGWLSSIYKARMKKKLPETFHQKNGEKSNQKDGEKSNKKDADKQINGFDIDDLVLFGKKSCGIIIDKENDTFKVLKGDVNGSEVVSINIRAIKKICIDKVFTATDRGMKTISIDDVVKVSEGPLEGREGIVRHMYKGVLFIYDECQSENNGFFCANSGICDLVKKSRDLGGGGKLSSRAGPSFAQSPIRLSEQDDNSQSFSRNQQSNSRGTFSVGQTLRIRKGPLKGYLCRVIRMYHADITVKLDSLGKLLTVDEKLLSLPNSKRDDATAMQCNMFGSQEEQLTDGLRDAGGGLGMDNFEFNAGMSSFGRDSWNTPSCSSFSFPRENDSKDPNQIADPWGSKLSSWNGDQEQGPANSWGKAASMSAEQSSWNKVESGEKVADSKCKKDVDAWSKASTTVETSTSGWPNDTPVQKTGQTWCSNGDGDGWDNAVHTAVEAVSDPVGWSKAKLSIPNSGEGQTLGEDSWNKAASKIPILSVTETSGWEQTKLPSSDAGGSWNTNGATADWKKDTSGKDRAGGYDRQSGKWASPKSVGGDNQDSWSINGKGFVGNNEDGWVKSAASQEIKPVDKNTWQTSLNSSAQGKTCKTPSADDNQASDWGASSLERSSQTSSWDKEKPAPSLVGVVKSEHEGATEIGGWKKATEEKQVAGCVASAMHSGISSVEEGSQSNSWGKLKSLPSSSGWEKSTETVGSWKTTTDGKQAAGWGSTSMPLATPSVEYENQTNSWDKLSASPSFDGWQKSKQADATAKEGWKKDGFSSEGQIDKWNKEKSSDRDQASDWNKAGNAGGGKDVLKDSWDKAKSSEGRGFGQESHGHWKAGHDWPNDHNDPKFGKSKDSDSGQGSSWSQGHFNNKSGNNWGHGNSWDQQRDFDGGRGSSRGRGRGRYGGRGGRNEDNFEKPGDSDGGWRFGMGKDRGRNGGGGYSRDNFDTREFGRGRGRGQGRGQFESSDWRNRRENFDGGFSNKPSSSWGNTEGSNGWGKSTDEHSAAGMDEKVGWNSGHSYGDGSKPGWGTDPQDAGRSTNDSNVDNASGWSKNVDTGKQIDNWSKGSRRNDNWNTPKTFDTKLSSWNQTNIDTAKGDATSSQSTDWKKNAPNSPDVSFVDWAPGLPVTEGTTNDDKWTRTKSSTGDHGDTLSGNLNSNNWRAAATLNKEKETGDSQGGWTSKKVDTQASQPSSENENNWGKWKEPCSGSTADGSRNLGSSKDWGNKNLANLDSRSSVWDSKKEPTSSHGNWAGKDSSGNQSSDWNNVEGNKWSKQSGGQGKSEGWSRGSDFGRGGGKGRDNSFSRGRGLGRNSGGRHSYGWNTSVDSGKEGNDGGQAFKTGGSWNRGNDTFEAEKDSWNSGANAEEGSWGSWKSGENQPTAQVQGSGWAASASASVSKVEISSADASPNLGSSKDCPDNSNQADCNRFSSAWDSKKEQTSMQGNWGGNDSSGKQSSDWNNDGGNKWNKQSGSQGKLENWSRGSFGRGGAGSFGRGGGRWRGRGIGRSYGDRGSSKEGNDGWQASNSNSEFKTGGRGNTEKASWGSWRSEGENQPAGRAKPGCQADNTKSSWDSPIGIGSNIASGWEPASAKDLVAEQSGQQMNNPWDSATVSKTVQGSSWNNKKSTGDSGPPADKQKNPLSEPDHVGSWDTKIAPSEDENSNKPPSLPVQAEDPKWQTSRNTTTDSSSGWGKADNSGNGGANSGW